MRTFQNKQNKNRNFPISISKSLFSSQVNKLSLINHVLLTEKFVNLVMNNGKKSKAYQILYKTMFLLENKVLSWQKKQNKQTSKNLLARNAFFQAIENVKPSLEVRKVRIARTVYQVPAIVSKKRQVSLAIRWILSSAKKRKKLSNSNFSECLTLELFDAFKKQGTARQKRDESHKLAEINRAYIRYRWW